MCEPRIKAVQRLSFDTPPEPYWRVVQWTPGGWFSLPGIHDTKESADKAVLMYQKRAEERTNNA